MANQHRSGYHQEYYQKVTKPARQKARQKSLRQGICKYCGRKGMVTIEHITPKSKGGCNAPENLCDACQWCNQSRGNRDIESWRASIARRVAGVPAFTIEQRQWLLASHGVDVLAVDSSGVVFAFEGGDDSWRKNLERIAR